MTKYFVIVFVAISAIVVACPTGAFAHPIRTLNEAIAAPATDDPDGWLQESGTASYYGPNFHGHRSAGGTRFNQEALTAAHPWLPFGSKVKVTLADTGRTVIVTITDRLYFSRRVVDLSVAAARQLGMINRGIAEVTLAPV
jgi:rare lipoprotein A